MKALLAVKLSPARLGSQMCLNVWWVSVFFVFMQQKCHYHSVVVLFLRLACNGWQYGMKRIASDSLANRDEVETG